MKQLFSNKKIFNWILNNFDRFEPFLKRIDNQKINPLVNMIEFNGSAMTSEKIIFVKKCLSLFPSASLIRGHCKQISFLPTLWFGKGSSAEEPIIVDKLKDAEGKFSLPCGYATFMTFPTPNVYEQRIELYDLPEYINWKVAKFYQAYVIIHEFAHTLGRSSFYWKHHAENFLGINNPKKPTYTFQLNGRQMDPRTWHNNFITEALLHNPITVYSSVYESLDQDVRIHEYLADYVAVNLIGIALNPKMSECWSGLDDRPVLKQEIKYFLNAEAVFVV